MTRVPAMPTRAPSSTFGRQLTVALLVALASGCEPTCPPGTSENQDQCVAHACSALPATKYDPLGIGLMARIDASGHACFWMDQTEVTVAKYTLFLRIAPSDGGALGFDDARCSWKTGRSDPENDPAATCHQGPSCGDASGASELPVPDPHWPVRCVDWCDARAFCAFAGERLCLDVPHVHSDWAADGDIDEWSLACKNLDSTGYPWGREKSEGRCNTSSRSPDCGPWATGREPRCASRAGVVDLIGNVAEWVSGCEPSSLEPRGRACLTMGGGFDGTASSCDESEMSRTIETRLPSLGFRCCADLTPAERAVVGL